MRNAARGSSDGHHATVDRAAVLRFNSAPSPMPRRLRAPHALALLVVVGVGARAVYADPPAPSAARWSLARCLDEAERFYPGLVATRHRILASEAQLDEAWVAPFLSFNVQGFISLSPYARGNSTFSPDAFGQNPLDTGIGYMSRVTADTGVPISPWTWVRLAAVRDAARAGVRVSEQEHRKARLELRANVRKAYFGLQFARDSLYLIDRAQGYLDEAAEHMREAANEDGGTANSTANDERQLRMVRAELRARRSEAHRGERVAQATLALITGVGDGFDIVDEPLCPYGGAFPGLSTHLTRAQENRPEVAMLTAGVAARRAAVSIQRWAYLPDLALGLTAAWATAPTITQQTNPFAAGNSNYAYWGAGLVLRWNFEPLANYQRVRRLSEELSMTEAQQRLALGGIALEVTEAYERVVDARERERAWDESERAGYEWFTAIFTEYQAGTGELSSVISPLRQYLTARFSHLQAVYDLDVALANLAQVTGDPDLAGAPDPACVHPVETSPPEADAGVSESEIDRILRESLGEDDAGTPEAHPDAGRSDVPRGVNPTRGAPRPTVHNSR